MAQLSVLERRAGAVSDDDICVVCRRTRDEHHAFVPTKVPSGCKCDPMDWRTPEDVPAICMLFNGDDSSSECLSCEHLAECHQ